MTRRDYLPGLKSDYRLTDLLSIDDPIFWKNYKRYGIWADIVWKYIKDKDLTVTGRHRPARGVATKILRVFIDEMLKSMIMDGKEIQFPGGNISLKIIDITEHISRMKYFASTKGRAFSPAVLYRTETTRRRYGRVHYYVRFMGRYRELYLRQLNSYHIYE